VSVLCLRATLGATALKFFLCAQGTMRSAKNVKAAEGKHEKPGSLRLDFRDPGSVSNVCMPAPDEEQAH
jgi:hypothetical protein